jgi:soluble lytic murein transglycosylase-like protein
VTRRSLLPLDGEGRDEGRRRACGALAGLGLMFLGRHVQAGAQIEEPLADSVRTALSSAVANSAPPIPEFADLDKRLAYLRWLGAMSSRLRKRTTEWLERKEFLQTVWYESRRAGLDPGLVLGLIQVESNFRKFAVSGAGARGYMQVMPFWTRVIGDGDASKLFHMQTNLRFGCVILRHYIDRERGDLFMALGRYNGSRAKPQYPNAVFGAGKFWDFHDSPPAERTADPTRPIGKAPGGPN